MLPSPWLDGCHWMAWAVLDGHAGWQTAEVLKKSLLPYVQQGLEQARSTSAAASADTQAPSEDAVQKAIAQGFVDLDSVIMNTALRAADSDEPLPSKIKRLLPAFAGSCALLSLYDPSTRMLHVACTGDSRAVLGRRTADGTWEAAPLSVDQTGSNADEAARLCAEHPGEDSMAKDGRVLGLMVSRAFGDGRWKWPLAFQQDIRRRFYSPAPLTPKYDVQTPPYLTTEPVVTSTKIGASQPCFLIIATDGLWDTVSSQQAVDLVACWLQKQKAGRVMQASTPSSTSAPGSFDFGHFWKGVSWKFKADRTTVQDENAAVHLVRNSLGGNHKELIEGRLAFDPPFSRSLRDDITVQVVFFNVIG